MLYSMAHIMDIYHAISSIYRASPEGRPSRFCPHREGAAALPLVGWGSALQSEVLNEGPGSGTACIWKRIPRIDMDRRAHGRITDFFYRCHFASRQNSPRRGFGPFMYIADIYKGRGLVPFKGSETATLQITATADHVWFRCPRVRGREQAAGYVDRRRCR
jgi:hypothetical protein